MGLEYIQKAKKDIIELKNKQNQKRIEHRNLVNSLNLLEVQNKVDKGRSETFNEVLSPIEAELKEIASQIIEIRTENDLIPSRIDVLKERKDRLEIILYNLELYKNIVGEKYRKHGQEDIRKTEEGQNFRVRFDKILKLQKEIKNEMNNILGI